MKIRGKQWWKVPVFCVLAGIVSYYLTIYLGGRFYVVTSPDGVLSIGAVRILIWYGILFLAALLAGWFFLRGMNRRELLCSATLAAALQLLVLLIQYLFPPLFLPFGLYLGAIFDWSAFLSQLWFALAGTDALWVGTLLSLLAPYLFVLLGRARPAA